jgi:hypothetical protein
MALVVAEVQVLRVEMEQLLVVLVVSVYQIHFQVLLFFMLVEVEAALRQRGNPQRLAVMVEGVLEQLEPQTQQGHLAQPIQEAVAAVLLITDTHLLVLVALVLQLFLTLVLIKMLLPQAHMPKQLLVATPSTHLLVLEL